VLAFAAAAGCRGGIGENSVLDLALVELLFCAFGFMVWRVGFFFFFCQRLLSGRF
jgi:phage shock protein PspC (stress-responsive transcriptional regulator)